MNESARISPQPSSTQRSSTQPVSSEPGGSVAEGPSRPGRLLHLLILLGPVAALLLANLAIAGLMQVLLPLDLDAPAWILTVIVVGQSAAVCALVVLFCALLLRVQGLRLRDAGLCWTRTSWASLLAGLGVGMAVVLAIGLPLTWSGLLRTSPDFGLPWWGLVIAGLAQAFLLQGLPEELLFRGYQMTALRTRPIVALFISAAVFGVIHLASSGGQQNVLERMLYLVMPFGFAIAGGALMILLDSLWAAVGVHGGVHVGSLIGLFVGLGSGPAFWVGCGLVWTMLGLVLLAVAKRRGKLDGLWTGPTR